MRKTILLAALLMAGALSSSAQNALRDEFAAFTDKSKEEYYSFRDRANREYADFLLSSWKSMQSSLAAEKPEELPVPPVSFEGTQPAALKGYSVADDNVSDSYVDEAAPKPLGLVEEVPLGGGKFRFSWMGMDLDIRVSAANGYTLSSLDANDISQAWKMLSGREFNNMILDCLSIRMSANLCDWAYLQMLKTFSESYLGKGDPATLLTAYLFAQSGYKMRLAMDEERLYMLFGSAYVIYGRPYFEIGSDAFYILDGDSDNLFVADVPYPDEKCLSLRINRDQFSGSVAAAAKLRTLQSRRYSVPAECSVSESQIAFFATYPQAQAGDDFMTRWAVHANAPMSTYVQKMLYPALKERIRGLSEVESLDLLLDFVQTAFEYKCDEDVWGEDRVFFAEETLYYPYSDCEDRAILLSRLVRDILKLDVVLVYYPNHLAMAVKLRGGPVGDYISIPEGKFSICDPTYIGAPVGSTMPGMDNSSAKILLLQRI